MENAGRELCTPGTPEPVNREPQGNAELGLSLPAAGGAIPGLPAAGAAAAGVAGGAAATVA